MNLEPLVLIVDDDDDLRLSIRLLLEEEGFLVEEASNGQEALDRMARAPLPSLVLLDLMMPGMDGPTVLAEIETRPELTGLSIVILTASDAIEGSSTLQVPLLRKPIDRDALLRIVEQYSPRFWDNEEAPTDERTIVGEHAGRDTARQSCAVCGLVAEARCSRCGNALCPACLAGGSAGACVACGRRSQPEG